MPRFGAACPLWPLYAALGQPLRPVEGLVEMAGPDARCFRVWAWAEVKRPFGLRGPALAHAAMLVLPESAAARAPLPIGSSCRVCPRAVCPARREPSILGDGA